MTQPRGHYKKLLCLDTETSGLFYNNLNVCLDEKSGKYYQMVSIGMIVVDASTLEELDTLYVEIKWNGTSIWNDQAESVHKLSKDYLNKNGKTETDAVISIGNFLNNHFDVKRAIPLLGHNVGTFDRYFITHLFERFGMGIFFGSRNIDTNSLGYAVFGTFNSDDLFTLVGIEKRTTHNALEDARASLKVVQVVRDISKELGLI